MKMTKSILKKNKKLKMQKFVSKHSTTSKISADNSCPHMCYM